MWILLHQKLSWEAGYEILKIKCFISLLVRELNQIGLQKASQGHSLLGSSAAASLNGLPRALSAPCSRPPLQGRFPALPPGVPIIECPSDTCFFYLK